MNEEYLWDKSGEDLEIRQLENALAVFRYQESAPPALPAKILTFPAREGEKKFAAATRRRFSFGFALAACAAIVLATFAVLFQFSNSKMTAETDLPQKTSTNAEKTPEFFGENESAVNQSAASDDLPAENVSASPQIAVSKQIIKQFEKTLALNKPTEARVRRANTNITNKEVDRQAGAPKTASIALTAEEKHAYEQLMLALSVTSRQLKIVKDKIDGIEDQSDDFVNER